MNSLAIAALICASLFANCGADSDSGMKDEWEKFKKQYNKTYETNETDIYRKKIWIKNFKFIEEHNKGYRSFKLAMNNLGDLNTSEYQQLLCARNMDVQTNTNGTKLFYVTLSGSITLPDCVDWRKAGYVTRVKDQGECGSCWAFSATGSLEGQHFKKTGKLVSLSEQNLVDCSLDYGNNGCDGGLMQYAFDYIKVKGIDTEASYPYKAKQGTCKFNKMNIGANVTGYVHIKSGKESDLQYVVATVGPISVAIDAFGEEFRFYKKGIYNKQDCNNRLLNHGVLVVGYGTKDGEDYWLVKNSWNTEWGVNGYIMMSRNKNNQCGIATAAIYPLVTKNDQDHQEKQATATRANSTCKANSTSKNTLNTTKDSGIRLEGPTRHTTNDSGIGLEGPTRHTTKNSGIRLGSSMLCIFVVLVFWH